MPTLGLIGKSLKHSFSKDYFEKKFDLLDLENYQYLNFEIEAIESISELVNENTLGFNVTIPYKEEVLPFLDEIDSTANEIGAVNTIHVLHDQDKPYLKGYNTDAYGFSKSIRPHLRSHHHRALILGKGGASKAVAYALKQLNIEVNFITRNPTSDRDFSWSQLNEAMMKHHPLLVNTTPLGMYPRTQEFPDLPYDFIGSDHLAIDLIYNPKETIFLEKCKHQGALVLNGENMLKFQAEKAWEIWTESQGIKR